LGRSATALEVEATLQHTLQFGIRKLGVSWMRYEKERVFYIGKETDHKWEEGDDISVLEFKTTEYGRSKMVVASEEVSQTVTRDYFQAPPTTTSQ
jgi:hypothetical protein